MRNVLDAIARDSAAAHADKAKQFGIKDIAMLLEPAEGQQDIKANELLAAGVWGYKNLDFSDRMPRTVIVGLKASPVHLGHLSLFREAACWARAGCNVQIVIGAFEELARTGSVLVDNIADIRTLITGYLPNNTNIQTLDDLTSGVWPELEAKILGTLGRKPITLLRTGGQWPDAIMVRVASLMVTAILSPQLLRSSPEHTVFPCGVNEAPFIELANMAARKLRLHLPGITVRTFLLGLDGKTRMSSRFPANTLFVRDNLHVMAAKLRDMHTGGRQLEVQRVMGGDVVHCQFFKTAAALLEINFIHNVARTCIEGRPCNSCKDTTIPRMLETIQIKREALSRPSEENQVIVSPPSGV